MTRREINDYQRRKRRENGNAHTKKYEKTKRGFLMRLYRNMQSRVVGINKKKSHLYIGKPLLDRSDFYEWADEDMVFHSLFRAWELAKYDRKLTPTVDRIDSAGGYEIGNMRWLTHSENSSLGARKTRKRIGESKDSIHRYRNVTKCRIRVGTLGAKRNSL